MTLTGQPTPFAPERAALARAALARAALARAALVRAEERTGTERWVRPLRCESAEAASGNEAEDDLSAPLRAAPGAADRLLPVSDDLSSLLPAGALERGTTVVVSGSTSLALALLARASRTGSWVALVGLPEVGVLAAHQLGLDLDRVVLVPSPGPDGPTVVAALLDGVDVVVVGPRVALGDGDRRRLSARARERSTVLLPTTSWSGAQVVLTAGTSRWEGLGRGYGRLRSRRLTVQRGGRGTATRGRRVEVSLPSAPVPWSTGQGPVGLPVVAIADGVTGSGVASSGVAGSGVAGLDVDGWQAG